MHIITKHPNSILSPSTTTIIIKISTKMYMGTEDKHPNSLYSVYPFVQRCTHLGMYVMSCFKWMNPYIYKNSFVNGVWSFVWCFIEKVQIQTFAGILHLLFQVKVYVVFERALDCVCTVYVLFEWSLEVELSRCLAPLVWSFVANFVLFVNHQVLGDIIYIITISS